jgi:iron(III) transport system permease protein
MTNLEARPRQHEGSPIAAAAARPFEFEKYVQLALYVAGWVALIVAALACTLPVLIVIVGGLSDGNIFTNFHFSIAPWQRAFESEQTLYSMKYSVLLALRNPVGIAIAFVIAWYLARNDVFGKRVIMGALWLAFFLPILPVTLGWIVLLDPNYGILNEVTFYLFGVKYFNIYSLFGISWVHLSLTTIPIMVILIEPAQRFIDSSYEEASTMSGAGVSTTLWRITLPLLAPTLLTVFIAGVIRSLESFEVEEILGLPAGVLVYSTRVFNLLRMAPPDEAQSMALSTFFLLMLVFLVVGYRMFLDRSRTVATMTGKGGKFLPKQRTGMSYLISAVLFLFLATTVLLPFSMVVLSSFSNLFGFFDIPHPWTVRHWTDVLSSSEFSSALYQSSLIGVVVSVAGTAIYFSLAWFIARNRFYGKSALSLAIWLPWALPGVLLGMACLTLFLNVPGLRGINGSAVGLIIVLLIQGLPLATHMFEASTGQISRELEESSLMSGAGMIETVYRVTAPIIAPMIASVFVISFMMAIKDISATVLLAAPGAETLPLLMFGYALSGRLEAASVVGVITVLIALVMAVFVIRMGEQNSIK